MHSVWELNRLIKDVIVAHASNLFRRQLRAIGFKVIASLLLFVTANYEALTFLRRLTDCTCAQLNAGV